MPLHHQRLVMTYFGHLKLRNVLKSAPLCTPLSYTTVKGRVTQGKVSWAKGTDILNQCMYTVGRFFSKARRFSRLSKVQNDKFHTTLKNRIFKKKNNNYNFIIMYQRYLSFLFY